MRPFIFILLILVSVKAYSQKSLTLTKTQMYADFDTLIFKIKTVSPHIAIKKDLWNYDALKMMNKLRVQIDTISSDFSFYLLIQRVFYLSQDMHTSYNNFYPDEMRTIQSAFKMYLPVTYIEGEYVIRESFTVNKDTVKTGTIISHINHMPVDRYIALHLSDRYYSYDIKRKKFYSAGFFKNLTTLFQDEVAFTFYTKNQGSKNITIKTKERFNYLNQTNTIADTAKVELWDDRKVLYIRLPEMNVKVLPSLLDEIEKNRDFEGKFNKIILDIRNNGGGQDTVWQSIYAKIIKNPVLFPVKIDDYFMTKTQKEIDFLVDRGLIINDVKKETNPLLIKYNLHTIVDKKEALEPAPNSINFTGKIIVLAENIYSSAGSSMIIPNANPSDNIISIGRKTGFFLGVGFSPLNYKLPNSQFTYRIAPSINVTNAKKLSNLMHDYYEIELPYSIQEFKIREMYMGNPYDRDFLINNDGFVKKALTL
jgi:C-terminal processing protease CtpA/Prc